MRTVGQTSTESDIIDLMREIDLDRSGTIDFFEFVHVISNRMEANESLEEIRYAFNLFDQNRDGKINFDDLKSTVDKYLKVSLSDNEFRQMIEFADANGRGSVSFDDFLRFATCRKDRRNSF